MTGMQGRAVNVAAERRPYPDSPCISVCALDDVDRCVGCGRTLEQIARWGLMSAQQQWAIIDELASRGSR